MQPKTIFHSLNSVPRKTMNKTQKWNDGKSSTMEPKQKNGCHNYLPLGRCPSERITTPNSAIVIVPSSSLSNSMNASLNSMWNEQEKKQMKNAIVKI